MKAYWRMIVFVAIFTLTGGGKSHLWAQENAAQPSVLHIRHSVTTSQTGFPQYIYMYQPLDSGNSTGAAQALTGAISLRNDSPNFSEVLWLLA